MIELRLPPGGLPAFPFIGVRQAIRSDLFPVIPLFRRDPRRGARTVEALRKGEVYHLNRRGEIGEVMPDWQLGPRERDRLWTLTLHFHEWAYDAAEAAVEGNDEAAEVFRRYISDWLERCRLFAPGSRDLAWNPYAVATRLGWWIRAYRAIPERRWGAWPDFRKRFITSLWQQAAYLRGHLEWDLRGNHLLRDAVGLAWAGRFFEGPAADGWRSVAAEITASQVREQVLPDGGHFERSPMYHGQVMEDLLTIALLLDDKTLTATIREAWGKMANYLVWVRHPDGEIPLLNDSALGVGADPESLLHLGGQIGVSVDPKPPRGGHHFEDTGLVVWHGDPWTLFFDAGPVGAPLQPGHAHADTFTLECSFEGKRLIVDPGTYGYDDDSRRGYDRSTDAHNTVTIDGKDSSEVLGIFRVGRRATPTGVHVEFAPRAALAAGTHDGYDFLAGDLRHERGVRAYNGGELGITDRILGPGRHEIRGGLLLEPSWTVKEEVMGWVVSRGARKVRVRVVSTGEPKLSRQTRDYHPEFGRELRTSRLCWSVTGSLPQEISVVLERI